MDLPRPCPLPVLRVCRCAAPPPSCVRVCVKDFLLRFFYVFSHLLNPAAPCAALRCALFSAAETVRFFVRFFPPASAALADASAKEGKPLPGVPLLLWEQPAAASSKRRDALTITYVYIQVFAHPGQNAL